MKAATTGNKIFTHSSNNIFLLEGRQMFLGDYHWSATNINSSDLREDGIYSRVHRMRSLNLPSDMLTQSVEARQPYYTVNAVNGRALVEFNIVHGLEFAIPPVNQPFTIMAVFRMTHVSTVGYLFSEYNAALNGPSYRYWNANRMITTAEITWSGIPSTICVSTFYFNGASSSAYHNGVLKASGNVGGSNLTSLKIGAYNYSVYGLIGGIGEFLIFKRLVPREEAILIENKYKDYYGIL